MRNVGEKIVLQLSELVGGLSLVHHQDNNGKSQMLSHLSISGRMQAAHFLPALCWAHHEKELGLIWQARGPFSLYI